MDILPPTTPESIAEKSLSDVISELDRLIDKTPIQPFTITSREQAEDTAVKLVQEKSLKTLAFERIERFATFANRVHKAITGKRSEYTLALDQRIAVLEAASVEWDDRVQAEAAAEAKRLEEIAAKEDEERRKEEAKALRKQGKAEEAKQVLAEPPRSFRAVTTTQAVRGVSGFSGFKETFSATCDNIDQLLFAVARPEIYREVAELIRKEYKGKQYKAVADFLEVKAGRMPNIPSNVFCSTKAAEDALDTKLSQYANTVDGKMDWPGVSITRDKKAKTRTR